MKIVIDASAVIKWLLNGDPGEQDVAKAEAILALLTAGDAQAFQPLHWKVEALSVVARRAPEKIGEAFKLLFETPVETVDGFEANVKAAEIAASLNHHMFDTLYHAVALQCDATLITADEAYFAKAYRRGSIKLLANFTSN